MQHKSVNKIGLLAAAGLTAGCLLNTSLAQEEGEWAMPPAQVSVVQLEERLLAPVMELQGNVIALQDATIAAEVEGQLMWIAEVGSKFNKGEVIARIDNTLPKLNRDRAEAELKRVKADLVFRESEVKRFQKLAKKDNAAKNRLQQEIAMRDMLKQDVATDTADLAKAERDVQKAHIVAPFDGVLVNRMASEGEFISVGEGLLRLVNTQHKEVQVATPLRIKSVLAETMPITVKSAGQVQELNIRTVVPVGDRNSRMVEVRLSAGDSGLTVGDSVKALMPKAPAKMTLAVPRDALVIRGTQSFVYRVNGESQAEQIPANIEFATGDWVSLKDGLNAGDKIIIRGAERLQPGQAVSILED